MKKYIDCKNSECQSMHKNMTGLLEESLCTQLNGKRVCKAEKSGFLGICSIIVQIFPKFVR